ncbi:FtsX-like permease family protein [bacterium]|jgi:putative ABC transport system permease protein|nr:FtsX-like permease family protein [bacterium]MBT4649436.1 FtsX-like permease family protein [bacterium]
MISQQSKYFMFVRVLLRNKTRSFLTSLGIIIGIASVIMIVSVGAGAQSLIANQIKGMGSNLIGILPGASEEGGPPASAMGVSITTLTYNDALELKRQLPEVKAVAAYVRGVGTITYQNKSIDSTFMGVSDRYIEVEDTSVEFGSFFTKEELHARVVVLGSEAREDLFGDLDPINKRIKINKESFRVVGVMEERGSAGFENQDGHVFVPLETTQDNLLGVNHIGFMRLSLVEGTDSAFAIQEIRRVLRDQHDIENIEQEDFTVQSVDNALEALGSITDALNYFLAAVAAISLIVGSIGIMNIMLVAVTERTREIGLRKAVGAKASDISRQFLIETLVLSSFGGVIGIIIGISISWAVSLVARYLGYDWDFVVSIFSVVLSISFTLLVGLAAGWYPAKKAAALNPVEALTYE